MAKGGGGRAHGINNILSTVYMARIRPYYYHASLDEWALAMFLILCFSVLVGSWVTSIMHMTRVVDAIEEQNSLLSRTQAYGWEELAVALRARQPRMNGFEAAAAGRRG